jgi:hypothetical protein
MHTPLIAADILVHYFIGKVWTVIAQSHITIVGNPHTVGVFNHHPLPVIGCGGDFDQLGMLVLQCVPYSEQWRFTDAGKHCGLQPPILARMLLMLVVCDLRRHTVVQCAPHIIKVHCLFNSTPS